MARVLLCFPATSYRVDAWLRAARALGVELTLATDLPAAVQKHGLPVIRVDFAAPKASLAALADVSVDAVLAVDEPSASLASAFAERAALPPYHRPEGVAAARDKRLMRRRLREAKVPVPAFWLVPHDGAPPATVTFPCVVKPPMLSGSQGVIRADDAAELAAAIDRVRRILARHPSPPSDPGFRELLLEAYVPGAEIAIEGLTRHGELEVLAVFDKPDPLEGPFFEETLYVTPSRHPAGLVQRAVEVAAAAALALGLSDGPIHAELRLGPDGPVVLEVAARSIGGLCSQSLFHALGGDAGPGSLEALLLSRAAGGPLARAPAGQASGVMMLPVPKSGVLKRVAGLEEARAVPGVDSIQIAVEPGQPIRALPEGRSYLGFAFAHGDTPGQVEEALRRAHAALTFTLAPLLPLG